MSATEKVRREQWMSEKTRKIKEITVRGGRPRGLSEDGGFSYRGAAEQVMQTSGGAAPWPPGRATGGGSQHCPRGEEWAGAPGALAGLQPCCQWVGTEGPLQPWW